jgi:kynurenine formamidase
MSLPRYADLPGGDVRGLFGVDDALGSLNRLSPGVVVFAASCIRSGSVFSLNAPLDWPSPGLFGRDAPTHQVIEMGPGVWDDRLDGFFPQGSSQWDGFRHAVDLEVGHYNGLEPERAGIDRWAERGIAGRGVLLDVARYLENDGRPLTFGQRDVVSVEDLQNCAAAQAVELREGDILLLRTGWTAGYEQASEAERQRLAASNDWSVPGLVPGHDMAAFLWDSGVSAIATDGPTLEAYPIEDEFLHHKLLGRLGIPIGELWWLDALADACRTDGRFDCFLTSAPIYAKGGVGSPANAIAIK